MYEDAPVPDAPTGSGVCVRVKAAAITFDELTWNETWEVDGVDRTPTIPSHEFAGVVVAVGPEAGEFAVGDEVFGLVPFDRNGAAAEYVLVPSTSLAVKPAGVSDVVAAAAVLPGGLTAIEALEEPLGGLVSGQRLLVRGGTGAVASFLTQFAHRMGLSVTVTVRSLASVDRAKQHGADEVLVADEPAGIAAGELRCFDRRGRGPGHPTGCTGRFDLVVGSSRSRRPPRRRPRAEVWSRRSLLPRRARADASAA